MLKKKNQFVAGFFGGHLGIDGALTLKNRKNYIAVKSTNPMAET